jgi:hypothetical protein
MKHARILHLTMLSPLLLAASAVAAVWVGPGRNSTLDFTLGRAAFHLAAQNGTLSFSFFSTMAEDEHYRAYRRPCWCAELALLAPAILAGRRIATARGPTPARGFPLYEPPTESHEQPEQRI